MHPNSEILWRLDAVERKLDLLLEHLGVRDTPAPMAMPPGMSEVMHLVQRGRKIEAIKAYRAATGAGLKEAKDAVEAMESGRWRG